MFASLATAQPRDAGRIQAGEDLSTWRALQEESPDDVEDLLAFLDAFPSSPLAEAAYRRLVELKVELPPELKSNHMARIATAYSRHEEALTRQPAGVVVATLDIYPEGEEEARTPERRASDSDAGIQVEAGVGLTELAGLYTGVGWRSGPWSFTARGMFNPEELALGGALRLDPWRYWMFSPFAELSALGPELTLGASAGLSHTLTRGLSLDVALGGQMGLADATPERLLRAGISQSF